MEYDFSAATDQMCTQIDNENIFIHRHLTRQDVMQLCFVTNYSRVVDQYNSVFLRLHV
jgi:hypothetical protein